jgi:hypothetical protein
VLFDIIANGGTLDVKLVSLIWRILLKHQHAVKMDSVVKFSAVANYAMRMLPMHTHLGSPYWTINGWHTAEDQLITYNGTTLSNLASAWWRSAVKSRRLLSFTHVDLVYSNLYDLFGGKRKDAPYPNLESRHLRKRFTPHIPIRAESYRPP